MVDEILYACGKPVDVSTARFGWLRESNDALSDNGELRHRLDVDGYLYLRDFLPRDQVQSAKTDVLNTFANEGILDPAYPVDEAVHIADWNSYFRPDLAKIHPSIGQVIYQPSVMELFSRIFGEPARHYDFTWFRALGKGGGTRPHCDVVYMGRGTSRLLTLWVPFCDIPLSVGGLAVVDGSHRWTALDHYRTLDVDTACENLQGKSQTESHGHEGFGVYDPDLQRVLERFDARLLTSRHYRMGDALIFRVDLLHGSLDNQTNRIRISSDSRYQPASEVADERWIGADPPGHGGPMVREMIC